MVNPMKNKKCHHYYDQEAVLEMIKARHKNKKKFRYVVPALSFTFFMLTYISIQLYKINFHIQSNMAAFI